MLRAIVAIAIGTLALLMPATPAPAESLIGPSFGLTGEIIDKHDRRVTLRVLSTQDLSQGYTTTAAPPTPGDITEVRIGFGARFLERGTTYSMLIFIYDGEHNSPIANVTHADGTPIDTSLLRRTEFRVTLALAAFAIIDLAAFAVHRYRHPRRPVWRL